MSPTVSAGLMIDETLGLMQSWSLDSEQSTTLASTITSGALTFQVTQARGVATGVSPGIIQIDSEMMYCDSVDALGNATVTAWGRGYLNTVPAAHVAGTRVISQPTFPRAKTLDAINETIARIFPDVYGVKSIEMTTTSPVITYTMPTDCAWVLSAKWQQAGGTQYWKNIQRFRMSPGGGTMFGDTGVTVDVADRMMPGRPIQFLYASQPAQLVNESDDFTTVTGLGFGCRDVVCLGAAASMTTSQELSRLQVSSIEEQNRSQEVAPSAALTSSRFLDQKFLSRMAEEKKSLVQIFPPRITRRWV